MLGRGEFIRLMFVLTGEQDRLAEPFADKTAEELASFLYTQSKLDAFRRQFFAVPCIKDGETVLANTGVIMEYLAERLGDGKLLPDSEERRWRARSLNASLVDVVGEGHDAWHAIHRNKGYLEQREQTQPFVDTFAKLRLPRWLDFFEGQLIANDSQCALVGATMSYIDVGLFHWLDGLHHQPPLDAIVGDAERYPRLAAFYKHFLALPVIADYRKQRKHTFTQTGPIF
jgi:glutathione S-transferase